MKIKNKLANRFMSILLSIALLMTCVPNTLLVASADSTTATEAVADPGTAHTWETMLGTGADGNRYAGRVWVDKSVYKDGDIAVLNTRKDNAGNPEVGSTFTVSLENDEDFQVIFSALGSSMTTTTTSSSTGPMDVVIVLDNSSSMGRYTNSATKYSRLEAVTDASNKLISQILSSEQNRLAVVTYSTDSTVILPLNYYKQNDKVLTLSSWNKENADNSGGVRVEDGDGKMTASATILNTTTKAGTNNDGFQRGTNLQSGIDAGMSILNSASDTTNRVPVVIVLTDGVADTAVTSNWYNVDNGTYRQPSDNTLTEGVALSTLMNASYWKALLEDKYGKSAMVYGVGVDLGDNSDAEIVMNPIAAFNNSGTSTARAAYSWFTDWQTSSSNVTKTDSYRTSWTFNQLPANSTITKEDVVANINYVDTYYDVSSASLEDTFNQIYEELSSGVFNPISSSTTVDGATGKKDTPLIYVDNIGQYMEIKEIEAVTLFGASYGVVKGEDTTANGNVVHNYTVQTGTGTNPTTNEPYNTVEDILITVTENADGTQKLEIKINQEILPIILEQVTDKTVSAVSTATINELTYSPLRVYYTVGLDSDILLPNGEIDVSKIDSGYKYINNTTGEITFYSNAFGVTNTTDGNGNNLVDNGDAHVGFKPSLENRYYYHQANHGIFTQVKSKANGSVVNIPENNTYGIVWDEDAYELTWMNYEAYKSMNDNSKVYTYVTYYRPTASTSDAANAAEKVTYLVYTDWGYLKESVAFYDATTEKYINYDSASGTYSLDDAGKVVDPTHIASYVASNPNADIYAVLGVGSLRTSRFHNMIAAKVDDAGNKINPTGTADNRYTPEYTHNTPSDTDNHYGNDVVVWLGNNGKLTRTIETGIALTKAVTEAIGNGNEIYELTVTVENATANPVVRDAAGNDVTTAISSYSGNVLTVNLKAGETVYITGIPANTMCTIGEVIQSGSEYYISSKTDTVTVPTLSAVLGNASQYVDATVTNAPKKYGDLTIIKDVTYAGTLTSDMQSALADKVFTFTVEVENVTDGKSFDTYDTAGRKNDNGVTVTNGEFTVTLKDNESITIKGLPEGTEYTVTETNIPGGFELTAVVGEAVTNKVVTGEIAANDNDTAHFVNTYNAPVGSATIVVSGTKTLNGTSYDAQTFNFAVQKWNGSAYETVTTTENGDNASILAWVAGDVEPKTDTYSVELALSNLALGTHYYRVVEVIPQTPVVGMTYDSTEGHFRVTVTDDYVDGIADVKVAQYVNGGWEPININSESKYDYNKDFTNTYTTVPTSITIPFKKSVSNYTGVDISQSEFTFLLTEVDAEGNVKNNVQPQEISKGSGDAYFTINYTTEGVYYYHLTEQKGTMAGMSYDGTTYLVTVEVTDNTNVLSTMATVQKVKNAAGETLANPEAVNLNAIRFENTYTLTNKTWTLNGTKELEGRDITEREFAFNVYKTDASFVVDGKTPSVVYNVDGDTTDADTTADDIIFSDTYTAVGNYYYVIKEVAESVAGMTYDTTHYHVTVSVTADTATGTLVVGTPVINKIGVNSGGAGEIVFVNTYKTTPTTYTISGTKSLTGRAMAAGEFTFALYEEGNNTPIETVINKADGSFTFSAINYTEAGTYTYTIKEVAGNAPGVSYEGVNKPVEVVITVTDTNSVLGASANISNANIKFENTYSATPAEVIFKGTKELVGATLTDNTFTFKLYETDHTFNIAGLTPVDTETNVNGAFTFDTCTLNEAGTHFYTIIEDATVDPITNIVYDGTQHNFRVQVSDDGNGQLKAVVYNLNTGTSTASIAEATVTVAFTNATFDEVAEKEVYLAANTTTEIDGEKVAAGDILTYYITYTNYTGEDAVVDIMDTIPAHTSYVDGSASHNGTYAGTHLNWVLNVLKGESVTVSFEVKVNEADAIMANTAIIRDGVNTYTTNEVVNHTVEDPVKDVFLSSDPTISIDGSKRTAGDELLYTIHYSNATENPVTVTIKDKIPTHTTYVENSADNGGVYADGEITWNLNLDAWEDVTVSFKVTVTGEGAEIVNEATVLEGNNTYTTNKVVIHTDEPGKSDPIPEPDDSDDDDDDDDTTPVEDITDASGTNTPTGDDSNLGFFLGVSAVCLIAIIGLVVLMKFRKKDEE